MTNSGYELMRARIVASLLAEAARFGLLATQHDGPLGKHYARQAGRSLGYAYRQAH